MIDKEIYRKVSTFLQQNLRHFEYMTLLKFFNVLKRETVWDWP